MNAKEIAEYTERFHGWIEHAVGGWRTYTFNERLILAETALDVVPEGGLIFEIGSYSGLSTAVLLHVARIKKARVGSCDMFMWNGAEAEVHLREVFSHYPDVHWRFYWTSTDIAKMVATTLPETGGVTCPPFVDHNINFLHIDGDHLRVAHDCELWEPHVVKGGAIAFHDANPNPAAEIGCMVVRDAMAATEGWTTMRHSLSENCLLVRRKPL